FMTGLGSARPDLVYSFVPHIDTLNTVFLGINLSQPDRIFLPILAAVLQFLQTRHLNKLNPPSAADPKDPTAMMTRQMQYIFPVMTYVISISLPSGLALYWAASTLFSIFQQQLLAKTFKEELEAVSVRVR